MTYNYAVLEVKGGYHSWITLLCLCVFQHLLVIRWHPTLCLKEDR